LDGTGVGGTRLYWVQASRIKLVHDRLPVALWPQALKREIEQAGFAKRAYSEVFAA